MSYIHQVPWLHARRILPDHASRVILIRLNLHIALPFILLKEFVESHVGVYGEVLSTYEMKIVDLPPPGRPKTFCRTAMGRMRPVRSL